jgi:aryl-alcohol dehydrogenase-like predicted oxidoreductase
LAEAQEIADIVCVQNMYNVVHRGDDAFVNNLAKQGIAYVPFFPLGGFRSLTVVQDSKRQAASVKTTTMQVALAWLLQRSPNILLIPGTSSVEHLRENLKAASLELPEQVVADLESLGEDS